MKLRDIILAFSIFLVNFNDLRKVEVTGQGTWNMMLVTERILTRSFTNWLPIWTALNTAFI